MEVSVPWVRRELTSTRLKRTVEKEVLDSKERGRCKIRSSKVTEDRSDGRWGWLERTSEEREGLWGVKEREVAEEASIRG